MSQLVIGALAFNSRLNKESNVKGIQVHRIKGKGFKGTELKRLMIQGSRRFKNDKEN